MDNIEASKKAIASVGTTELHKQLVELTGKSELTIFAVRKWRQRGIPGEWIPAVCAITGFDQHALNPLAPKSTAA